MSPNFSLKNKTVWVAGETGMVGRAMLRRLENEDCRIISAPHAALDLTNQQQTYGWIETYNPDVIVMAAAKVGGIGANAAAPASFLHENVAMAQNVIHGAYYAKVQKLIYLGSSCIYPKMATQPIKEEALLTGALEPTNEGYALAKITGLKLCQFYRQQYGCDFISVMPTNLYGAYDHFDENKSHVIPAIMMKIHMAQIAQKDNVVLWGTGAPLREFLHVDDLAKALVHLLKNYSDGAPINIGSGQEISIADLAMMLKDIIGYDGIIEFDTSKPDGTPRKLLDSSKINDLGWKAQTLLKQGLERSYDWFQKNVIAKER